METVKGFSDFTGEEAKLREKIRGIIVKKFELYSFEPAETPVIEFEEFVKGENMQDEAVSDIFRLKDKGERNLALRYEFTFQLKRIAKGKKMPYKRYQIGPVFRDEPATGNRFRQFIQCDMDIIGSTPQDEAEILALASEILTDLNVTFEININNRKLLNEILEKEGIKEKQEAIKQIDKLDKLTEKEVEANLKKIGAEKLLGIFKKSESYFKKYDSYKEIKELKKFCEAYEIKINFQPSLARGLSYYNSTIFEIKTSGMKETICAGGSYLVDKIQSTGISFGLERISKLAKVPVDKKEALIVSIKKDDESIKLAQNLRKAGINSSVWFKGGISKALDYGNSYKIPFAIFVGEEEVKQRKFKLKDMTSGKEEMVSEAELIKKLS